MSTLSNATIPRNSVYGLEARGVPTFTSAFVPDLVDYLVLRTCLVPNFCDTLCVLVVRND